MKMFMQAKGMSEASLALLLAVFKLMSIQIMTKISLQFANL